ncbi:hypothetical protein EAF00_007084 [Botryotinia globosa]|nr:hypothetical protein EAF00_007084 [Botryotinia globosa]
MATTLPQPEITLDSRMSVICQKFFSDNPAFPKNHRYLGQVLPLTLIILHNVKFFDVDKLIVFIDSSKVEGTSNGNLMLDYHCDTSFDHDFTAHLMNSCKSVVGLCIKGPRHHDANPNPVQVPNLELQLVLIDQVLESKAKEVQKMKRKSTISA